MHRVQKASKNVALVSMIFRQILLRFKVFQFVLAEIAQLGER